MCLRLVRSLFSAAIILSLAACSTTYSHYGRFYAKNSSGEDREFLIQWLSQEPEGWSLSDPDATPVYLTTQCSSRKLVFYDPQLHAERLNCNASGNGAVFCGDAAKDQSTENKSVSRGQDGCGLISGSSGGRITDLGREISVLISCKPIQPKVQKGDEVSNFDYLAASVVPYQVKVKKVIKGSFADKPPRLTDTVCEK